MTKQTRIVVIGSLRVKGIDLEISPPFFVRDTSFVTFFLLSCILTFCEKGSTLKRKDFAPFSEGRQKLVTELSALKVYPFPIIIIKK